MFKILMITYCLFYAASVLALDIVKDGKAVSEIVLAKDANQSQKLGAADLQEFFEKISGAKVEIVPTPSGKFKNKIYVGESDFTKKLGFDLKGVEKGGYKLVVADDYAIVAGRDRHYQQTPSMYGKKMTPAKIKKFQELVGAPVKENIGGKSRGKQVKTLGILSQDDTGSWYAASELLQQLGVRWYHPNETIVPSSKDIVLKKQNLVKTPVSAIRHLGCYQTYADPITQKWFHRMKCGDSLMTFFNHTTEFVLSDELTKANPTMVAKDKDAEPVLNHRGLPIPKLTDPAFRRYSLMYVDGVFKEIPDLDGLALGMPDGFGRIDYEDSLKFKIGKTRWDRYSNYVWDYWGWAAKEYKEKFPGKLLNAMAYTSYLAPPDDLSLVGDNVVVVHCFNTNWLIDGSIWKEDTVKYRDQWLKILPKGHYAQWDYFLYYGSRYRGKKPIIPAFFTKILQEHTQVIAEKSAGKFIEVGGGWPKISVGCPGLVHFLLYWQSMLFWNPNADREKVMNEYYHLYFGPAEKEMKEFYEFAENAYCNPVPLHKYTPVSLKAHNDKYFEILTRARAKAGKNSVYERRVAEIESEIQSLKTMHKSLERKGEHLLLRSTMPNDMQLDADPSKYKKGWRTMRNLSDGDPIAHNKTEVAFARSQDKKTLYVIAVCHENDMKNLKATVVNHDDGLVFNDDSIEIFVDTADHSFFQLAINSNGAIFDRTTDSEIVKRVTRQELWSPGTKAVTKKLDDRWIVEVAIPTVDFGINGPTKEYPWGFQVGRNRWRNTENIHQALAPTGGGFAQRNRWANLIMR